MLEERCAYYEISRVQRVTEISRGHGLAGTQSYEDRGCYECEGDKTECRAYYVMGAQNDRRI